MTKDERFVILASSLGTVFEWYDFYLYGALVGVIGAKFFSQYDETTRNIFALLAFAAGFLVRPFGALVFGRLGDLVGRKYTFLVTILIMGSSTFLVGCLPTSDSIGVAAPILLIALRLLQGLALGGEYGGAATYVAEHAPKGKRGAFTSWIQTTATLGFFLSLAVIYGVRHAMTPAKFEEWGWRLPFLFSIVLIGVGYFVRRAVEAPLGLVEVRLVEQGVEDLRVRQVRRHVHRGERDHPDPRIPHLAAQELGQLALDQVGDLARPSVRHCRIFPFTASSRPRGFRRPRTGRLPSAPGSS